MSGGVESWPALSFLEGLRPGSDETVELALLGSYSADLGTIGATLLALAGKDSDEGRGSPSDFADAVERLRGKVRIIIQRGRLAKMRRTPRIAAVLDQFVREVPFDEALHSWHPKTALVRTRSKEGGIRWRLWIGSRNLTECVNRDIGLLLTSGGKGGAPIPGANEVARALADKAALKDVHSAALATMISKVAWQTPAGIRVERIHWSAGNGDQSAPVPPTGTDEIVIVSPFIDKTFLARQTTKDGKPVRRVLLTTMREIERIGPSLASFDDLLALDAPDYPVGDPDPFSASSTSAPEDGNEEEQIGQGLHAKLLFMRAGRKRMLWLGSANATMRAWTGRNVEVTAELIITDAIESGLKALLGAARLVQAPDTVYEPEEAILEEEALERARAQVAARWGATLSIDGDEVSLTHRSELYTGGPHPDEPDVVLEIGALHGELIIWPPLQKELRLGTVVPADRSEFVRLRVSRGANGLSWLQRAPAGPPFGEDRDRAAFVRFLGARGFFFWVAGLLADDGRISEGDWADERQLDRRDVGANVALDLSLPTLEGMLAAWARDRHKFREIERRVSEYLPAMLEHAAEEDLQTVAMLRRFNDLWGKLRLGLDTDVRGKRP